MNVHLRPYIHAKFGHPHTSKHVHIRPLPPTSFGCPNMPVDSHVQANFERPQVAWVAMNYVGLPRY